VTFDVETKNKMRVFEIYKSPEVVDAHIAGTAFGCSVESDMHYIFSRVNIEFGCQCPTPLYAMVLK
jgi:quinol monooxygenase YgiN